MANTINIFKQIKVVGSPVADLDCLYGPHESTEAALSSIPLERRVKGRTVGIFDENGSVVEYWWKSGVSDTDLVKKMQEAAIPTLSYTEDYPQGTTIKNDVGDRLVISVKFSSSTYGQCTITAFKNGNQVKSIKADKGIIEIDLGVMSAEGTNVYTIKGQDALTIPAEEVLSYNVVTGGASISTDMQDIIDNGINTSTSINTVINASVADTSLKIKVNCYVYKGSDIIMRQTFEGSGDSAYRIVNQSWNIGKLGLSDTYSFKFIAYTGTSETDTDGYIKQVEYNNVLVLNENDFRMSSDYTPEGVDTATTISVPFRIYSGSSMTLRANGSVINSDGVAIKSLDRSVPSNTLNYWSIGKIANEGDYKITLWATTIDGGEAPSGTHTVEISMHVDQHESDRPTVVKDGLMAEFIAEGHSNNNDEDIRGVWTNEISGSDIHIKLTDLNYDTNGWKHVDQSIPETDEGEMMLKFSGNSYGELYNGSNPYNPMEILRQSGCTGFTAEIIYRTRCIGELDTKVMTGHSGNGIKTAGFSASYETLSVGSNGVQNTLDVSEDEWIHAAMVIDKTIHTNVNPSNLEDYADSKLMVLYINGVMCSATELTDTMTFTNYGNVVLNAAINPTNQKIEYFGDCEIKAIRFYNRPLLAHEVKDNFIASIYDKDEQDIIIGKNSAQLPTIKFVNLRQTHDMDDDQKKSKGYTTIDFELLNQMTLKSEQKKRFVVGAVHYEDPNNSISTTWDRCIIQTQGTSSLVYPVKNYKIKIFGDPDDSEGKNKYKTKLNTDIFRDKGWQDENTFTLKCDYMEAAHLNNTPTCMFYNKIIDRLRTEGIMSDSDITPSRRDGMFDAIKGFPCVVYFYESEEDFANDNGTYVGTYMFNIDKSGNSLGFKADANSGEMIPNPRYNPEDPKSPEFVNNICQSFEGVANSSNSAGCFYSYESWKTSFYNDYCEAAFAIYKDDEVGTIDNLEDFVQYYAIDHPEYEYRVSDKLPVQFDDSKHLYKKEDYISSASEVTNEYEYYALDYEPRYDYDDLEEGGAEFWGDSTWGWKRALNWVSDTYDEGVGNMNFSRFKNEFNSYFNFKMTALYYLQMIVFGQVDNPGKNSMWDSWDGIHWQPRPYDLDSQAGLQNEGFEKIEPDAELIRYLSPFRKENHTTVIANYSEDVSATANSRYSAYNTRTSKFWIAFATAFKNELSELYATLRNLDIYTIDNIMREFKSHTIDIIGEKYYNIDMVTKFYKLADTSSYITRMHGNRIQRFKSWMTKRLVFCDTLFGYSDGVKSLNEKIIMRSDAISGDGSPVSVNIVIRTYSPQYVLIDVGSTRDAMIEAYCSPDSEYIDPITGERNNGTLFTLPIIAGNKEIQVSGCGNIREIVNLSALRPSSLVLTYARKIISLDLSYSTKLTALALNNNDYLQYLDCRNATLLGSDAAGAQLDLSNCVNLKRCYLDKTKLTSVVFPVGGALQEVSVANTTITSIELSSLHFLTDINVSNCENILRYSINNCPKLLEINASDLSTLNDVRLSNCLGLQAIRLERDNSISSFSITNCPNIDTISLSGSQSSALNTLDLTTLFGLKSLDISGSMTSVIKFPRYKSLTSSEDWGSDFRTLTISGSRLTSIQYGEKTTEGVDMGQLTALERISFSNCYSIKSILNLNYTGSCNSLFSSCSNLMSISGSITCVGGASSIFYACGALEDFSRLSIDFSECTSLYGAFQNCPNVKLGDVKRFIDACGERLTSIQNICYNKYYDLSRKQYGPDGDAYTVLPDNFFGNCKNVTSISGAFYNTNLKSISDNSFKDESENIGLKSCTSANYAFGNTSITSIPSKIVSEYLPSIVNLGSMFISCSSITSMITDSFFGTSDNNNITNINSMFYGCSRLVVNMGKNGDLLKPLKALVNAHLVFANCTNCTDIVQEGFFAYNPRLYNIAGFFSNTSISGIPQANASLFRKSGDTSSTISSLKIVGGLFNGCRNIGGVIGSGLFAGAEDVTDAGFSYVQISTGSYITTGGVFQDCNNIQRVGDDLFKSMPNVTTIAGFFKNCTNMMGSSSGDISSDMFITNTKLTDVSQLFYNCQQLRLDGTNPLFNASKRTIRSMAYTFYNCLQVNRFNYDTFTNMPSLNNVQNVFYRCGLSADISGKRLFSGCNSLQNASGAFNGCEFYGNVSAGMFDSCRSTLSDVSYMFANCRSLDGIDVGDENQSTITQYGLLANCVNLTTTEGMFDNCYNITGAYPWDIFYTSNTELLYSKLKNTSRMFHVCGFNVPTVYDGENYMIHPDFFSKLISVTNMSNMFSSSYAEGSKFSTSYQLHPNTFSGQYFLENIQEMFYRCSGLGGAITNAWFYNSISSLTNAIGAFAYTNINDVGSTFLRVDNSSANVKLTSASKMFYGCSSITSNLPVMYNTSMFTKINYANPDLGYRSYAYGCTRASNYNQFSSRPAWTDSQSY